MTSLRPYQTECLETLKERYRNHGVRRALVALPTGTGKTFIFAQFPRFFGMKHRLLVLTHTRQLITQTHARFQQINPDLSIGIEQAHHRAPEDSNVVIASVPSVSRDLSRLDPDQFLLVVADEAHHAVSTSWRRVLDHLGLLAPDTKKLLVGFTATPHRGDGVDLHEVFQEISFERGLDEMIQAGYLCPITGWNVRSDVNLDTVSRKKGDFDEQALARSVNINSRNALVLRAFKDFAPNRRTLIFAVTIDHARSLAETFLSAGYRAAHLSGQHTPADRKDILNRFASGDLQVLVNCMVLSEGYDLPRLDCVLMARPTMSRLLYAQMIGRGTRTHDEKSNLLVIDIVDNSQTHCLAGLHSIFDLPKKMSPGGKNLLTLASSIRTLGREAPWVDPHKLTRPEDLEIAATRIEFFRLDTPADIRPYTALTWFSAPGGGFSLSLPSGARLNLDTDVLGRWNCWLQTPGQPRKHRLHVAESLSELFETADSWVRQQSFHLHLLSRDESWRGLPCSSNQRRVLNQAGIDLGTKSALTRGQASFVITQLEQVRRTTS